MMDLCAGVNEDSDSDTKQNGCCEWLGSGEQWGV